MVAHKNPTVRIIGGRWRSRKISFPDVVGLRPTQDRIRETLFNWLMHDIEGAHCLDLFAGTGALGFEALSRGANHVTFVDSSSEVIASLHENAAHLQTSDYDVIRGACPKKMVSLPSGSFNIVFLDPPFQQNFIEPTIAWLLENNLLASGALIYVEREAEGELNIPNDWSLLRDKQAGNVRYCLLQSKNHRS